LPLDRLEADTEAGGSRGGAIQYGRYFTAARGFLEQDGFALLMGAVSREWGETKVAADLDAIEIHLVKHGHFYHPAKVTATLGPRDLCFVLNAALTEPGLAVIDNEYAALERLNQAFPFDFLPRVHGRGAASCGEGPAMKFFLGQWLQGFQEFHLARNPQSDELQVILWDAAHGPRPLSHNQSTALIRRAAMILTAYYDLETTEMIFPWHHAAGDFVVRVTTDGIDVKLITVRGYPAMLPDGIGDSEGGMDPAALMQALILFLAGLTLRMRIDRIDGIHEVAWYPPWAIAATLEGFHKGLDLSIHMRGIPAAFGNQVDTVLRSLALDQWREIVHQASATFHPQSEEAASVREVGDQHARELFETIRRGGI
jgi:hypothetical protein